MKLKNEWGTIYVAYDAKSHIIESCRYCTDRHTATPIESIPENHIDLCSLCEQRFQNWRDGLKRDGKNRCDRCGKHTDEPTYCRKCETHVERIEARKR